MARALTAAGDATLTLDACSRPLRDEDAWGLVELFAGIGGGCRAAELAGMQPRVHAVCENSTPALKVLQHHWPEALVWHDVRKVGATEARALASFAPSLKVIVFTCGSPCQGVSGANSEARLWDDPRTQLLWEIPRVIQVFKEALPGVEMRCLTENVASMAKHGPEVVREFNKVLGVLPVKIDAAVLSGCARDRFYWVDWPLAQGQGVEIEEKDLWTEIALSGPGISGHTQKVRDMPRGDGRVSRKPFPTFMRSVPRGQPLKDPVGLAGSSKEARQRWAADGHREPLHHYELENLILTAEGPRTPSAEIREELMGYVPGHTVSCWPRSRRSNNPQGHEDARRSLIGNAFDCHVVAWLLSNLAYTMGWRRTAPPSDVAFGEVMAGGPEELIEEEACQQILDAALALPLHLSPRFEVRGECTVLGVSMGMSKIGYVTDATWVYRKELEHLLVLLKEKGKLPEEMPFSTALVNVNPQVSRHVDKNNEGATYIVALGDYQGGHLLVTLDEHEFAFDLKGRPLVFNGKQEHSVQGFNGNRLSVLLYSHVAARDLTTKELEELRRLGFRPASGELTRPPPVSAIRPCQRPFLQLAPVAFLTAALVRRSTHRGGEIRLPLGRLGRPGAWPPRALKSCWFEWDVALAYKAEGQHINVLEMRAFLAAVKWRVRQGQDVNKIFVHMLDSQVCIAAAAKGRSSSRMLNRVLHRLNCLLIANSCFALVAYFHTSDNPADRPSRWAGSK